MTEAARSPEDRPVDRRVRRTQRALRDALVSLILEKGYEALTVEMIAARADVTRASFYKHYPSKEALLNDVVEEFAARVRSSFEHPAVAVQGPGRLRALLHQVQATPEVMRVVLRGEGDGIALRRFVDLAEETIADGWDRSGSAPDGSDERLAVMMRAGAVIAGVRWYLDHLDLNPDEARAILNRTLHRDWANDMSPRTL